MANAQATRGTLLGTVTDQSGAAIPGATVTATETRTNVLARHVTNETGHYMFPNMADGIYKVKAELQGFKTVVRESVRVTVNSTIRVDLTLDVGAMTETVTVSGRRRLLQTDRADTGRTIESVQVAAMPLAFNRNFQGMRATVPGAAALQPHSEFFNSQDSLATEVNGQSRLSNNVQIDGLDNNHTTGLLTVLIPPAEAIDSVSVTTSNFDAEFGRAAGAVTSVVLKSGTNQLKGSAFWFGNTEKTNALPASSVLLDGADQAADHVQPVRLHDRRPDQEEQALLLRRLPADGGQPRRRAALRRPDRGVPHRATSAGAPTKIYDPATGDAAGNGPHAVPGQPDSVEPHQPDRPHHPGEDPAAEPARCRARPGQLPDRQLPRQEHRQLRHQAELRVTTRTRCRSASATSGPRSRSCPATASACWGGPLGGGFMATGTNMTYSTAANWTRTLSNTFIMEVRGGTSYYHNEALTTANGQNLAEQVGIPGVNLDEWTSGPTDHHHQQRLHRTR